MNRRTDNEQQTATAPPDRVPPQVEEAMAKALSLVTPLRVVVVVVLLVVLGLVAQFCSTAATIDVTVNGTPLTLHGAKTMQTALKESGLPINPGDLISLRGQVLKNDQGKPFSATVNGQPTSDPDYKLANGDVITLTDGDDIVEDYDVEPQAVPYGLDSRGLGAIRQFTKGADGVLEIRTGKLSGDVVEKQTVAPTDLTQRCYNPVVGDDKVVALTFDGGPDDDFTPEVLEVLAENGAHATFFCTADQAAMPGSSELMATVHEAGHQICAFGYSSTIDIEAAGLSKLSAEEQVAAIENARARIAEAIGQAASPLVRLPAGYMQYDIMLNLEPYVETEIGWTIDSGDWANTTADEIYDALMLAEPGDVIRLHDGDGNRTATVEALKKALPRMADKGYSFITMDDMLKYPQP